MFFPFLFSFGMGGGWENLGRGGGAPTDTDAGCKRRDAASGVWPRVGIGGAVWIVGGVVPARERKTSASRGVESSGSARLRRLEAFPRARVDGEWIPLPLPPPPSLLSFLSLSVAPSLSPSLPPLDHANPSPAIPRPLQTHRRAGQGEEVPPHRRRVGRARCEHAQRGGAGEADAVWAAVF